MKRLLFVALLGSVPAWAADLGQARELLAQRKAAEAWALLSADEASAGDPEYDYLLGLAALDSGRASDAVTALERLLAVNPSHNGARMELARAYFALGADGLAQREFAQLQALNPPPQARGAIEQYLRAIDSRTQGKAAQHRGFLEAGLGFDDNITAVTDDFTAGAEQTYGIPNIQPSAGNATRRRDGLYTLTGGWNYRSPVTRWMVDADLTAAYRGYFDNSPYNSASIAGGSGLGWRHEKHFLRAGIVALASWQQTEQSASDGEVSNDRLMAGLSGQWRYDVNRNNQSSLQLQYNQIRYADVPVNDINQLILTAGWTTALGDKGLLLVSAWAGQDTAINSLPAGQDYSRTNVGARLNGQWQATARAGLYALLGLSQRRDSDEFARASVAGKGRDLSLDLTLGSSWQLRDAWSLRAQYSYSQNNSSFDLYDFQRNEVSCVLRRDFR